MADKDWKPTVTSALDRLQEGLTLLIDHAPADDTATRHPTNREIAATNRNHYEPTPRSPRGTRNEPADPVRRAVEAREWEIHQALTDVHQLLDDIEQTVIVTLHQFGLEVLWRDQPIDRPQPPGTITNDRTGRTHVTCPLPIALGHIARCHRWATAACNALDTRRRTRPTGVDQLLETRLDHLAARIAHVTRRHGRDVIRRRLTTRHCDDRYGYDCHRPLVGEGPRTTTCNPCQQRAYRDRKAAAEAALQAAVANP